jgi:hypothetical protein
MSAPDNGDLAAVPAQAARLQHTHLEEARKGFVTMATIPADPQALLGPVGGMPQVQFLQPQAQQPLPAQAVSPSAQQPLPQASPPSASE